MPSKNVGVVLSGCGYLDGSEIHESVLTLLFLDRAGARARCFAPRGPQAQVVDHRTGSKTGGQRDMLEEAGRIARGAVEDLAQARTSELDAVILPGGYGAATNLSDFAARGAAAEVRPDVRDLLRAMHAARKPIGVICIAPAVLGAALRGTEVHPRLTIGDDADTAAALEAMGSRHERCPVDGIVIDADNRIVSTPAYMFAAGIAAVASGIERLVGAVLELAEGSR